MTSYLREVLTDDEVEAFKSYRRKYNTGRKDEITKTERAAKSKYEALRANIDPVASMYYISKTSARRRGIEFDITLDELRMLCTVYDRCPLTGEKLEYTTNRNGLTKGEWQANKASLDRINNEYGYSIRNCWIISCRANQIKSSCTLDIMRRTLVEAETRGLG